MNQLIKNKSLGKTKKLFSNDKNLLNYKSGCEEKLIQVAMKC